MSVDEATSSQEMLILKVPDVPILRAALSMINIFMSSIAVPSFFGDAPSKTTSFDANPPEIVECGVDKKRAKRSEFEISTGEHMAGTALVDARFPSGPVSLLSDVIVGPSGAHHAQLKFIPCKGNSSWAVGVVSCAQKQPDAIWRSRSSWFRGGSGVSEITEQLEQAEKNGDICALLVDYSSRTMTLNVAGKVVGTRSVPVSEFPLRIGICGHRSTRMKVLTPMNPQIFKPSSLFQSSRFHNRLSGQECRDAIQSVLGDAMYQM